MDIATVARRAGVPASRCGSSVSGVVNVNAGGQWNVTGVDGNAVLGYRPGVTGTVNVSGAGFDETIGVRVVAAGFATTAVTDTVRAGDTGSIDVTRAWAPQRTRTCRGRRRGAAGPEICVAVMQRDRRPSARHRT